MRARSSDQRLVLQAVSATHQPPDGKLAAVQLVVDSGATNSLVPKHWLEQLAPNAVIDQSPHTVVRIADGQDVPVAGEVRVVLDTICNVLRRNHRVPTLTRNRVVLHALVADTHSDEILVGWNDLDVPADGGTGGARCLAHLLVGRLLRKWTVTPLNPPKMRFGDMTGGTKHGVDNHPGFANVLTVPPYDDDHPLVGLGVVEDYLKPPTRQELEPLVESACGEAARQHDLEALDQLAREGAFGDIRPGGSPALGVLEVPAGMEKLSPYRGGLRRPIPPRYRQQAIAEFARLRRLGVITDLGRPGDNPNAWISPTVILPKPGPDGTVKEVRITLDAQVQNAAAKKLAPHTTVIGSPREVIEHTGPGDCMWGLDIRQAFFNGRIAPGSQRFFTTLDPEGQLVAFQGWVMGWFLSPGLWTDALERILVGEEGIGTYADNVWGVTTRRKGESDTELGVRSTAQRDAVVRKLIAAGIPVNIKGMQSQSKELRLLGYILTPSGYRFEPEALDMVRELPIPWTRERGPLPKQKLQQILGTLQYTGQGVQTKDTAIRFWAASDVANRYVGDRGEAVTWAPELDDALVIMRDVVLGQGESRFPDYAAPWLLETDASQTGFAWIASYLQDGTWVVCYAHARQFNEQQRKWGTRLRELFGLVHAVRKLRDKLLRFVEWWAVTDHGNLLAARNATTGMMAGWWPELISAGASGFQHTPGKSLLADAPSRITEYPNLAPSAEPTYGLTLSEGGARAGAARTVEPDPDDPTWWELVAAMTPPRALGARGKRGGELARLQPHNRAGVREGGPPPTPRLTAGTDPLSPPPAPRRRVRFTDDLPVGRGADPVRLEFGAPAPAPAAPDAAEPESPPEPAPPADADAPDDTESDDDGQDEFGLPSGRELNARVLAAARAASEADIDLFRASGARVRDLVGGPVYMIEGAVCFNDSETIAALLVATHDRLGHGGVNTTLHRLSNVWWPNKKRAVHAYIHACMKCQIESRSKRVLQPRLNLREQAVRPLQVLAVDHIPIPGVEESAGVLHVHDTYTRYGWFRAVEDLGAGPVEELLAEIQDTFGPIGLLITDQAKVFTKSKRFKAWCKTNGVEHHPTHEYNPRANPAERPHAELRRLLSSLAGADKSQWPRILRRAAYLYNTSFNRSIDTTPFSFMFGRHPTMPVDLHLEADTTDPLLAANGLRAHAERMSLWAALVTKERHDRHASTITFNPGDRVLVAARRPTKQHNTWDGPVTVVGPDGGLDGYYLVSDGERQFSIGLDRMQPYDDSRPGQVYETPFEPGTHEVEAVLDERTVEGVRQLLIKWKGSDQDSWERASGKRRNRRLLATTVVKEYLAREREEDD